MLGTLAVMGILSVGGMWAYNTAMDRHRANTLIQEAQKRAVIVAGQIGFNGNAPNLTEFELYNNTAAGRFSSEKVFYEADGLNKQFGIKIENVKKSVCQNVLNTIGEKTPIRRLSKEASLTTPITTCDDEGTYVIIYNESIEGDGDTQYCTTHTDCGECGTCDQNTHLCIGECESACSTQDECGTNDCVVCDDETKTCQNKCDEVDYLESNGSQYIDTGLSSSSQYKAELKFNLSNMFTAAIFGSYVGVSTSGTGLFFGTSGTGIVYCNHTNNPIVPSLTLTKNKDYVVSQNGTSVIINGSTYTTPPVATNAYNMMLFARSNNGTVERKISGKIYYFKLYNNGSLVRDFIPVLAPHVGEEERKACMFDKVSKKLFCGVGTFDYGPKNNL